MGHSNKCCHSCGHGHSHGGHNHGGHNHGGHNHGGHSHGGHRKHGHHIADRSKKNKKRKGKGTRHKDAGAHKFVMKGKEPPKAKDGIIGPSRLTADEMTTIYTIPNENFKTEVDVVSFNGYDVMEQIGKGGFAIVFKAKNTKTGQLCALKTVKVATQDALLEMKNELFIMERVKNPFAVQLHLHFLVNQKLFIFMQLADAGCFGKMLEKGGVLDETDSKFYFGQMCAGVEYMHSANIAHRDIKPANFLMAEHPSGKKICMVSDYGLSRVVHKDQSGGPLLYTTQCGTPVYMAPEILKGATYNCYLVDVWSLGVTLFAMLNLMTPFNLDNEEEAVKLMMDKDWEFTKNMKAPPSSDLKEFMNGLLEPKPEARFTIKASVSHKWLKSDYESVKKLVSSKK